MAKTPKMTVCKTCNSPIAASAKICPNCGAKNKKPFYKRGWFILVVLVLVIGLIGSLGGGRDRDRDRLPAEIELPVETPKAAPTAKPAAETEAPAGEESPDESEAEEEPEDAAEGIRPAFKEAMDSYEAFYDDYCDLLEKYGENPTDLSLLAEYTEMMSKVVEMDEKFEAWEEEDLNNEELKYYLEVSSRVAGKMIDAAG